jgi:hypothetical protein
MPRASNGAPAAFTDLVHRKRILRHQRLQRPIGRRKALTENDLLGDP